MNKAVLTIVVLAAVAGLGAMAWFTLGAASGGSSVPPPSRRAPPAVPVGEAGEVVELDDAGFDGAVVGGVVLVDFYATWCGPCRQQGPAVERLAGRYAGRVLVAKLDVDRAGRTAGKFGIRSIPTLLVFRDGKQVAKLVGLQPEEALAAALDKALADG